MPQIFHPSFNTISRVSVFGAVVLIAAALGLAAVIMRSPYATGVDVIKPQPVPFSHQHHVGHIGIDCRVCHTSVEESSFAGIPPTETCMICHSQLWSDSPLLAPVRESYETGRPLEWTRVHDLADFAYFDHSIHIAKGVACVVCHGEVNDMPLMWKAESLAMEWCLSCHRNPERHFIATKDVFAPNAAQPYPTTESEEVPEVPQDTMDMTTLWDGNAGKVEGLVKPGTNCSVCHR